MKRSALRGSCCLGLPLPESPLMSPIGHCTILGCMALSLFSRLILAFTLNTDRTFYKEGIGGQSVLITDVSPALR